MDTLSRRVGEALKAAAAMLVTAESCTGGWMAQAVTAVPGSSDWFERGFVVYSDDAKRELLGVAAQTLSLHGAVSEEAAREMARGALGRSRGTLAAAITGIAGPGGGSVGKPVGTVCFAWASTAGVLQSETCFFRGDRTSVREQSVIRALEGVLRVLQNRPARGG